MNVSSPSSSHGTYSPAQETEITHVKYVKINLRCTKLLNIPHAVKQALRPLGAGASEHWLAGGKCPGVGVRDRRE